MAASLSFTTADFKICTMGTKYYNIPNEINLNTGAGEPRVPETVRLTGLTHEGREGALRGLTEGFSLTNCPERASVTTCKMPSSSCAINCANRFSKDSTITFNR